LNGFRTLLVAFAVLMGIIPLVSNQYVLGLLTLFCIYAFVAVGLDLLVGNCGQPSFGHSGFFALGSYGLAVLSVHFGVPLALSAVLTLILTLLVALSVAVPALRLRDLSLAIATFAFAVIAQTAIVGLTPLTGGVQGMASPAMPLVMNRGLQAYFLALLFLLLGIILSRNLVQSRTGRAWRAVATNEVAAISMGIKPYSYKTLAIVISAAYAGIGGMLFALESLHLSNETFAPSLSIAFFAMVVVGGRASLIGSLLGTALYVFLPEFLQINTAVAPIVFGLVILVTLRFFPDGLVGLSRRLLDHAAAAKGARA